MLGVALLSAAAAPSAPSSSSGLYVVSAAGGKSRKVVDACVESVAWSPDGRAIAYKRVLNDNESDAVTEIIDLRTGRTKRLADEGRAESPSWSPDGTRVAFDTGAGILVGLRTGPSKARLVASGGSDYWPVVSSSGARPKPLAPMYLGGWARHRLWWFTKLTGRTACTGAGCVGIDQSCPSVSRVGEPGSSRVPPTPAFARGCRLAGRRCLRRGSSRGTASSAPRAGRRRSARACPPR